MRAPAAAPRLDPSALRQAARMTVGAAAAYAIVRAFALPQGYWAVFTVVIVMQASIGATLSASLDRLKGTLLGAGVGAAAAALRPETPVGLIGAVAVCVAVTSYAASVRASLKVAPVTAVIMLISPANAAEGPLVTAAFRVVEIAAGSLIGLLATYLIFPARSAHLARDRGREALLLMADSLEGYAGRLEVPVDPVDADGAQLRIRAALAAVEAAMDDAERERALRIVGVRLSRAFPRTLWRVRNDCVSLSRTLGPFPEPAARAILAPTRALVHAVAALMRRCAEALDGRTRVEREGEGEALAAFEAALAQLRRSRLTHDLELEPVGRLFGLAFALESLHRNLNDLADRIDETAASPEA